MEEFEAEQWMVISWIPLFTGTLSLIGSSSIIYMILSDWENKLAKPNHRFMLLMSAFDVLSSAALATSTWPSPRESPIYGSKGNMTTCKVQYFFATLGLAVPMYNASLCLLFLLTIRYRVHQRHFATRIEPYLHTASVLIPLTLAIVPIAKDDVIPYRHMVCSIKKSSAMGWPFLMVPVLSFCICLYSLMTISCFVSTRTYKMRRYSYGTNQMQRRSSEKNAFIRQSIYYTAAFVITFLFPAIYMFALSFPIAVLMNIFYPLQGFWNFLLYIRPNIRKMKKTNPDKYLYEIIWSVIFHSQQRNEVSSQKWRKDENKHQQNLKQIKENLDMDMDWRRNNSSEESKQEITDELPRPIAVQSRVFNRCENNDVDASHIIESGSCDESIGQFAAPQISPLFATVDDDLNNLNKSTELCVVPQALLVLATVDDDLSLLRADIAEEA